MRIHLFDPAYIRPGGHHVEWDSLIARELVASGLEVRLFCNVQASEAAVQAFSPYGRVLPLFEASPYAKLRDSRQEASFFFDMASSTARVLEQSGSADAWLWSTLFLETGAGVAFANHTASSIFHAIARPSDIMRNWLSRPSRQAANGPRYMVSATLSAASWARLTERGLRQLPAATLVNPRIGARP